MVGRRSRLRYLGMWWKLSRQVLVKQLIAGLSRSRCQASDRNVASADLPARGEAMIVDTDPLTLLQASRLSALIFDDLPASSSRPWCIQIEWLGYLELEFG